MRIILLTILVAISASCGSTKQADSRLQEGWGQLNNPANLGVSNAIAFQQIRPAARLARAPWSGDYWATYRGGLAYRWQSGDKGNDWRQYIYQPLTAQQIQSLSQEQLNALSPAEKYDLLSGDWNFTLTRSELANTQNAAAQNGGSVPTWFGLCHGWAPAAFMELEPAKPLNYNMPGGGQLTLYASDQKALLTKLYTSVERTSVHVGGRCNAQAVARDAYGRPIDLNCRDINPGAWHLTVTAYINAGRSFVAEVSNGAQVWNQPALGYAFAYSNYRQWNPYQDPYANVRARGTTFLVDVNMNFEYIVEVAPHHQGPKASSKTASYQYTLELDAYNRIIGGEWHSKDRPDFLWMPTMRPKFVWGGLR